MAQEDGSPGINKLARTLDAKMKAYLDDLRSEFPLDFGEIENDYSLKVNSFPKNIPKGAYRVCRSVADGNDRAVGPGDHVLVAWVQNKPVVIDAIVSSMRL